MIERRDRQFDPGHTPDLFGPQTRRVHNMLGLDSALFGDNFPAFGGFVEFEDAVVLNHLCAMFLCSTCIGMDCARGVNITFSVSPHAAENAIGRHDRAKLTRLLRCHQAAIVDADGLECAIRGLQPFPAVGRAGERQTARHVHTHRLTRFFLNLAEKVDGVGLQLRNIRIGVECMKSARRVPA